MGKRNLFYLFATFAMLIFISLGLMVFGFQPIQNQHIPEAKNNSTTIPSGCGNLTIYFLNVSQADATLIITPKNKSILIDAGSAMKKNSSTNMVAFLKSKGISQIDAFIATHYHEDHIGGIGKIFSEFDVKSIYENGNCGNSTSATAKEFRAQSVLRKGNVVKTDMDISIGDDCLSQVNLIVAYDRAKGCWLSNENENSILVRIAYGNTSVLIAGDCGEDCESELLTQGTNLGSTTLRIGHHGSVTSSSNEFLGAVAPTFSIISTDYQRSITDGYFHPRSATLERIYQIEKGNVCGGDACVFRTDLNGNIKLTSDGNGLAISPARLANECDIFRGYVFSSKESYSPISSLDTVCFGNISSNLPN